MSLQVNFDEFWQSGRWAKKGRNAAKRQFYAQIKTPEDWRKIQAARDAFDAEFLPKIRENIEDGRDKDAFIPHGSTFFGRGRHGARCWLDYVPDKPLPLLEALPEAPSANAGASYDYWCTGDGGHEWTSAQHYETLPFRQCGRHG